MQLNNDAILRHFITTIFSYCKLHSDINRIYFNGYWLRCGCITDRWDCIAYTNNNVDVPTLRDSLDQGCGFRRGSLEQGSIFCRIKFKGFILPGLMQICPYLLLYSSYQGYPHVWVVTPGNLDTGDLNCSCTLKFAECNFPPKLNHISCKPLQVGWSVKETIYDAE